MFGMANGMMHSGRGVILAGGRVFETGGHIEPWGIVCMVLGLILWAVVVTALVLLIIDLIARLRRGRGGSAGTAPQGANAVGIVPTATAALGILEERYARGEMSHEEYVQRKADLTTS